MLWDAKNYRALSRICIGPSSRSPSLDSRDRLDRCGGAGGKHQTERLVRELVAAQGQFLFRKTGTWWGCTAGPPKSLFSLGLDPMMVTMSDQNTKATRSSIQPDQQPIQRTIGKRVTPPSWALPSPEARAAMTANARYITRAPKGIFFYKNHEEMIRDRERWTIDAVIARQTERG
jgi:hypothetical protein